MKIENVEVYGLAESIVASGLPMKEKVHDAVFRAEVRDVDGAITNAVAGVNLYPVAGSEPHLKRAKTLAACKGGESHDCYLCGIIVQFNMTAPRYFFPEFGRYHFADIISSTSTMHKLKAHARIYAMMLSDDEKRKFLEEHFDKATDPRFAHEYMMFAGEHLDDIHVLKANLPEGWLQTVRVTTNYRQLKTMYHQRHDHRLQEWKDFCAWIASLPMANQLIIGENNNG